MAKTAIEKSHWNEQKMKERGEGIVGESDINFVCDRFGKWKNYSLPNSFLEGRPIFDPVWRSFSRFPGQIFLLTCLCIELSLEFLPKHITVNMLKLHLLPLWQYHCMTRISHCVPCLHEFIIVLITSRSRTCLCTLWYESSCGQRRNQIDHKICHRWLSSPSRFAVSPSWLFATSSPSFSIELQHVH